MIESMVEFIVAYGFRLIDLVFETLQLGFRTFVVSAIASTVLVSTLKRELRVVIQTNKAKGEINGQKD